MNTIFFIFANNIQAKLRFFLSSPVFHPNPPIFRFFWPSGDGPMTVRWFSYLTPDWLLSNSVEPSILFYHYTTEYLFIIYWKYCNLPFHFSTTDYQLPTSDTDYQISNINYYYRLPTTYYLLPSTTTDYLLPTTYYLLFSFFYKLNRSLCIAGFIF